MLFEQTVNQIYNECGKSAGIRYNVEFKPYARFKIGFRSKPTGDVAVYSSDYLKFTKPETVVNLANKMTKYIKTREGEICDENFIKDFSVPNVYRNIRPLWAGRCHGIIPHPKGAYMDLMDIYQSILKDEELMQLGEFKNVGDILFTWKKYKIGGRQMVFAQTHPTPRAITVNKMLDNKDMSIDVMRYLIYHELLHIDQGLMNGSHNPDFRRKEARYPNAKELELFFKGKNKDD